MVYHIFKILNLENLGRRLKISQLFLSSSINLLPGPKHPASKYYHARKTGLAIKPKIHCSKTSNPERSTKRLRDKRRAKYAYDKAQFEYYNQRRKVVRTILQK